MYTNYKQQYAFGFGPCSLKGKTLSSSAALFYGTEVGDKDSLANAKMIDLKADKQMAYEKALLQFRILEAPVISQPAEGDEVTATIAFDIVTCGMVDGAPDTANAEKLATVYFNCANAIDSYEPFEEITFPKAAKEFVGLKVSADNEATFTGGKFLVHFNPFI